jgi:hypothetical protein
MTMMLVRVLLVLCVISPLTLAASIQWTGSAGNSLWNFANNWLGNAVPTGNDDVIINALGGSSVQISQPAVANSVTIAGGQYPQGLILLSSLTVGNGGINVQRGGTLQVQNNNNLPLVSSGPVQVQAGSTFAFQSGAITGPGHFNVNPGATLAFSTSALKLISAANLTNWGTATVQGSTIEVEKTGSFNNYGNLTIIGNVNFFSNDNTGLFENYGGFVYQGSGNTILNFQLNTYFYNTLDIAAGSVTLNYNFKSNATINLPSGSTLTVGSGTSTKNFNVIKGSGVLVVQGIANVNAPVSLSVFEVSDSGTLTFNAAASFQGALIGGIVNALQAVTLTNLTLAGGTLTGPGTTTVSGNLWLTASDTGNTNNFLSSTLALYGQGQSSVPIYFLLGQGGQFHIASGATFNILSTFSLGIQAGKPLFIVDGTLSVTLGASQTITTNVDIAGSGSFKLNAGTLVANGDTFTIGTLFLAVATTATLNTVVLTAGTVSGTGNLNLTAAPTPTSSISSVALTYFGIVNGVVNIGSFAVTTFEFWSGTVTLAASSTNTATVFDFYGGALAGAAKLTTTSFNLNLRLPVSISGTAIKTSALSIQSNAVATGTIQTSNGATIGCSASSAPVHQTRSGVVIA